MKIIQLITAKIKEPVNIKKGTNGDFKLRYIIPEKIERTVGKIALNKTMIESIFVNPLIKARKLTAVPKIAKIIAIILNIIPIAAKAIPKAKFAKGRENIITR
ncbi:MAG: hypothetical protein RQ968_07640 [Thermoproteota archaeon]|jgi:hypothetical protein|nr:hypothetical protein [Thermoproteota archaeon]